MTTNNVFKDDNDILRQSTASTYLANRVSSFSLHVDALMMLLKLQYSSKVYFKVQPDSSSV